MLKSIIATILALLAATFGIHHNAVATAPTSVTQSAHPPSAQLSAAAAIASQTAASTTPQFQDLSNAGTQASTGMQNTSSDAETSANVHNSNPSATSARTINATLTAQFANPFLAYATKGDIASATAALDAKFQSQLTALASAVSAPASGLSAPITVQAFAPSQRINNLSNITVSGVSGLTASDIPALAYLSLDGGTLTGALINLSTASSSFAGALGIGTTTPGSIFSIAGVGNWTSATSTYYSTGGINLASGCFAIAGNCVGGGGSGTIGSGIAGQFPFYAGSGTTLTATSSLYLTATGNIGIGTTTPGAALTIQASGSNNLLLIASPTGASMLSLSSAGLFTFSGTGLSNQTPGFLISNFGNADPSEYHAAQLMVQNPNDINCQFGQDYCNEVRVAFRAGTTADHREYLSFQDHTGTDMWLTGRNGGNAWILYDSADSLHRMYFSDGTGGNGETFITSVNSNPVSINHATGETSGTAGLTVWAGGIPASNYLFFKATAANGPELLLQDNAGNPLFDAKSDRTLFPLNTCFHCVGPGSSVSISSGLNQSALLVNGFSGQTTPILNISSAAGTIMRAWDAAGNNFAFTMGGQGNQGVLSMQGSSSGLAQVTLQIQEQTSQTGAFFSLNTLGGLYYARAFPTGGGTAFQIHARSDTQPGLSITRNSSSSSATLQEWQNELGTAMDVVKASGSVGIGTSSPLTALSVQGTAGANDVLNIASSTGASLLYVNARGYVGIGTTSPSTALQVNGVITPNADNTSSLGNATYRWSSVFAANGTIQTSDARLKSNVDNLGYGLSDLLKLRPVSFTWIAQPQQGTQLGFIAQEVQPIFPETVNVGDDANHTLGLTYTEFIPIIVKSLQQIASISDAFQANLIAWLGSAGNGIADLFAKNIYATNITTHQLTADELCAGTVCVNQQQLAAILAATGQAGGTPGQGSAGGGSGDPATSTPDTPPIIQINGDNPATIQVGDTYNDLGATITGPAADLNLGLTTYLNSQLVSQIAIDTSQPATDTIQYVASDQNGLTATSTRTVIIQTASSTTL